MISRKINIINNIIELKKLFAAVEEFVDAAMVSPQSSYAINLSLEELITNTISYGYNDKEEHKILIELSMEDDIVVIRITDDALPFDPLEHEDPDTSANLHKRPVGGLGIFLVKQMMDHISYSYKNGKNCLIIKKSK